MILFATHGSCRIYKISQKAAAGGYCLSQRYAMAKEAKTARIK
jgi:hypothetical protein